MNSDETDLAQSFLRARPMLLRYARGRTGEASEGEDIVQDAWLRVVRHAPAVLAAPVPYMLRVVRNLAIDHGRAQSRRLRHDEVDALLDVPSASPGPEQSAIAKSELQHFVRILRDLTPRRRDILIAARLRREPYASIAKRHGVSTRTVEYEVKMALEECLSRMQDVGGGLGVLPGRRG
ncbi:sigma-70 family RNA polymerase sigma factor [Ketogulonicigenium vulgare]|uniref:RNA polymerase sigma-70 factor, ECF subfamily protein n=1 Tax=Ketogulonicigenium vulgare (strain WSH-001) TaxID=759362 RepID=F9Y3G8_KETVW|nr:sigma-70 family RNA polymerase sigma factor [Ketogulonicigenium vulgare]ADO43301.1 ECF family RNA polymerase sigma factor [Ketogulonicigenium vulgare Y25]AEM41588.1 RNA polymerase sigma-70 factor, ECF subfamily protein [Ketogulonicigenium vulgare WSH-001]ALJ81705.1 RNA polymerase subunit sigma-70 [Ketogulonicigenium vulgare]ANW34372.1 RNA polymerase subunit sigma-70 [Ketogulonicigenium vulgare]